MTGTPAVTDTSAADIRAILRIGDHVLVRAVVESRYKGSSYGHCLDLLIGADGPRILLEHAPPGIIAKVDTWSVAVGDCVRWSRDGRTFTVMARFPGIDGHTRLALEDRNANVSARSREVVALSSECVVLERKSPTPLRAA